MYAGRIVEYMPTEHLFTHARHPYTNGLLGAMPSIEAEHGALKTIPGQVPQAGTRFKGCSFAPRCTETRPICHDAVPALETVAAAQRVACHVARRS